MRATLCIFTAFIFLFATGCSTCHNRCHYRLKNEIPISLHRPEVDGLTVKVNGATIRDPDGPFLWKWGDGTTERSYFPNEHTYDAPGFFQITVEVSRQGQTATKDMYLKLER